MEALFAIRMGCIVSSCDGNIISDVTKHRTFNHSCLTTSSTKIDSQCKPFITDSGLEAVQRFFIQ